MDPRFFHVETMDQPEPTELRKPFLYRYFKRIPENGQFTFMDGGWMEEIVRDRVHEQLDEEAFGKKICSIKRFERTLSDNGYTILKFFFYIDENEQKKRMEELLADENTAWRVSEEDLWQNKSIRNVQRFIRLTWSRQISRMHRGMPLMQRVRNGQSCRS